MFFTLVIKSLISKHIEEDDVDIGYDMPDGDIPADN